MLEQEVLAVAQAAKNASPALAQATAQERNAALTAMARALRDQSGAIVAANAQDMDAARQAGTKESLLDRLMLDEGRVMAMADALEDLVALPDPLGRVFDSASSFRAWPFRSAWWRLFTRRAPTSPPMLRASV